MLGDNYLVFENVALPNPTSLSISNQSLETVKVSVSGKDLGITTRLKKRTFACTFQCTSTWLDQLFTLCQLTHGALVYRGESIDCRARMGGYALVQDSEYADRTDGLWNVTVNFLEV